MVSQAIESYLWGMKKVWSCVSHILLVLMVIKVMTAPVIYVDFKMQQDYIAQVLCINKDKPKMKCDGQCVLMQKLQKSGAEEDAPEQTTSPKRFIAELLPHTPTFSFMAPSIPAQHVPFFEEMPGSISLDIVVPPPSIS